MKKRILAIVVVGLLVTVCLGAYTRDVSRDLDWGILYALEYMIGTGIPVTSSGTVTANAGTNLNTSALALDTSVDGLEGGLGTATTTAVDGDAAGSAVAHLRGINKKLAAGVSVTEASAAAIAADLNELTAAPVAKAWVMGGAVVAAGPAPAPLAAAETFARKIVLTAVQADGTANTGIVYVGDANLVDTTAACIQLAPGDSLTLEGSPSTKFDLNLLRMDGANVGDGVRYLYQPI